VTALTLLVPYTKSDASARLLRLACRVVAAEGGRVVVLALTQVHRALPLEGLPAYFDEKSWYALCDAEKVARGSGAEVELTLHHTYHKAKTIIRESHIVGADAILLPVERPRYAWLPTWWDGTQRFVTKHATCPVITGYFLPGPPQPTWNVLSEVERILDQVS
jgi:hypothetical protein